MNNQEVIHERNFERLLYDSVVFAQLAEKHAGEMELPATMARASILSSLLLSETAANTCLDSLGLDHWFHGEIDRMTVLGKLEFFLLARFRNRSIDIGRHEVGNFKELKRLRNDFVHPKAAKVVWTVVAQTPDGGEKLEADCDKTNSLGVRNKSSFWAFEDAIRVMKGTHEFLSYYFRTLCKFTKPQVSALLFSPERVPDVKSYVFPCWDKRMKNCITGWGVELNYLDISWM